ncbi:pyridoxine kinase like protein [Zymoseptoria brevis]|uniref:pyridoxal kinase n=1 Tax=Zymoseptoria brevis TaxID=1047168 RepID=A0A0F4G4A5_9PEZI|nr:pyridoxine kinase like protein [Zymoseptoria brevis]
MAESDIDIPETHVLAIASHVTSGYVGNTMATFCMQTLGCEVSAIHTVNYSNHVGYKQFTGRASTPTEVASLYTGLQSTHLDTFSMLLTGYCPSASLVHEIGRIGRSCRLRSNTKPGSFFWILDPVMGDNGRIYVAEDTVPAYKSLLKDADCILPNQFEAELLSGVEVRDWEGLRRAVEGLHGEYQLAHVVVTSVKLPPGGEGGKEEEEEGGTLWVIGSSATKEGKARMFRIQVPALPVFFSGTGDMFAALLTARLREAAAKAGVLDKASWRSPDEVRAEELPLAKAMEKVLASMQAVLKDTARHYNEVLRSLEEKGLNEGKGEEASKEEDVSRHLKLTRAAEVRVVRNARALREPPNLGEFKAVAVGGGNVVEEEEEWKHGRDDEEVKEAADDLGVLKVAPGITGQSHQT